MDLHALVLGERLDESAEQLEAVPLAIDDPKGDELPLLLAEGLGQHPAELPQTDLVRGLGVDDGGRVSFPIEHVEQLEPSVLLFEVDALVLDVVLVRLPDVRRRRVRLDQQWGVVGAAEVVEERHGQHALAHAALASTY